MSNSPLKILLRRLIEPLTSRRHENIDRFNPDPNFDRGKAEREAVAGGRVVESLFWGHKGRLVHKWPHYFPIYERAFDRFRAGFPNAEGTRRPLRFLEIGVSHGGSLQLWRKYFGPDAIIFGIDVDPRCQAVGGADVNVRIGSQADPEFLRKVVAEMGGVDLILDDGSHIAEHQSASLDILFPLLSEGGVYVIEDVQTSYWRKWQGGYRKPRAFIEVAKSLIDDIHAPYHKYGANRDFAARELFSVAFYDGVIALEKQRRTPPFHIRVGEPSF